MKGTKVLISENPRGRFFTGVVSGALKPGTVVQVKNATAINGNGQFTFELYDRDADGNRPASPIMVLLERGEGYDYSTAYTDGDQCQVYVPLPGDEFNMLWAESGTGTGDAVAVGDLAMVEDATGYLKDTSGSIESEPFMACEALTDVVAAGTMCHVMYTGH